MTDISEPRHEKLAETLRGRMEDDLRSVRVVAATEEGAVYEHLHLRDDLEEEYTAEENQRIAEEVVFHTLGQGHRSSLFRSGKPNYTVYAFDKAFVVLFYESDEVGTAVSLQSGFDGRLREIADVCLDTLGSQSKI